MRIVIVGGGLAGLAAALECAEAGHSVRMLTMGHHLGGRATSWHDPDGYPVEHGLHMMFGYYFQLRRLMARAGIDEAKALHSTEGVTLVYEPARKLIGRLEVTSNPVATMLSALGYDGLSMADRVAVLRFATMNSWEIMRAPAEHLDNECYARWATDHGLPARLFKTTSMRLMKDAMLAWPHEISAYVALQTMRSAYASADTARVYHWAGPMGEVLIDPMVRAVVRAGVDIQPTRKLVGLVHDGARLTGLRVADPDPDPHALGGERWEGAVPTVPGTEELLEDFDAAIVAIPQDCFAELTAADPALRALPGFKHLDNLRSAASISWQLWLDRPVLPPWGVSLNGLPQPLNCVWDAKAATPAYAADMRCGSVLMFVGQESGFEDWDDARIMNHTLEQLERVPGCERVRKARVVHSIFQRNRSNHERFPLTEPGVMRFRPGVRTALHGLYLAGDWVRSPLDFPCMEGAVVTGLLAAHAADKDGHG